LSYSWTKSHPDSQDADASGQEAKVSNEEADDPDDCQLDVDKLEALAGSREKVPTLKDLQKKLVK
jgi:hypothetical protein